ncbi:hypothetical protein GQ44DRAFT_739959 [Phaeosphaeriaceae sp. PMI808]|nr:hypothetical protein GQ44DRAFT_739959 [Phaeosphaeriaceae sp. PMI808]
MVTTINNRYALFEEDDGTKTPEIRSPVNASHNPFLNQVADDTVPWQEVKRRGGLVAQTTPSSRIKTLPLRFEVKDDFMTRERTWSASTLENSDKQYDPYENWCGVCSQRFPSKTTLVSHMKQTPDHKNYCNLCRRVFKDRNGLQNHLDNSRGHEVHCNVCLSAFNDDWGLRNHFENNSTAEHQFVCLICLLAFRSLGQFERHLQTAEKHTWCATCERRFRNQDERDEHWQKTTRHKHCLQPGCDFDAHNYTALNLHLQEDHFQCTKLNKHSETCKLAIPCPRCRQPCAGQAQLALHLTYCFFCKECNFLTHHEGNYKIHMTKHASATIFCWGCKAPMRTYSSLINHLESSKCPEFPDPSRLIACLGKWWYSPLYMDLDIHAHLRTGRINPNHMRQLMDEGSLHPFVCRGETCTKTFGQLSSLVLHCESQACGWDVPRLNMPGLEREFKQICLRRDSGAA